MNTEYLSLIRDYGALMVGVALLLLAVSVLPGRIKWYVLTAGLAVLGYEAYMRTVQRKLLKEADAERTRLRGELAQLDYRRTELEGTVSILNQRLAELNGRMTELNKRKETLLQQGDDLAANKRTLDEETERLLAESREIIRQVGSSEAILAKLTQAQQAVAQMDKITQ